MIAPALFLTLLISADTVPVIPFRPGLQLTWVTAVPNERDWESQIAFLRGDSAEAILQDTWFRTGPNGTEPKKRTWERPVSAAERRSARSFNDFAEEGDKNPRRGFTWFMVSAAVLDQLKRQGQTTVTYLGDPRSTTMRGTLTRVGPGTVPFPVLVDSRRLSVPAIRARGTVMGAQGPQEIEIVVLDQPASPWLLEIYRAVPGEQGGRRQVVRIGTGGEAAQMARTLETDCTVTTSDILFASGSAQLDPASSPAIAGIAQALKQHPDWQLKIVGHTDSIGTAASNLDLSRRRADRVRQALISDHSIAASRLTFDGRGETQPLEDNGTVAGRARNRRVDLARNCP